MHTLFSNGVLSQDKFECSWKLLCFSISACEKLHKNTVLWMAWHPRTSLVSAIALHKANPKINKATQQVPGFTSQRAVLPSKVCDVQPCTPIPTPAWQFMLEPLSYQTKSQSDIFPYWILCLCPPGNISIVWIRCQHLQGVTEGNPQEDLMEASQPCSVLLTCTPQQHHM